MTIEPRSEWTRDPFGAEIDERRYVRPRHLRHEGRRDGGAMAIAFLREAGVPLRGDVILQAWSTRSMPATARLTSSVAATGRRRHRPRADAATRYPSAIRAGSTGR